MFASPAFAAGEWRFEAMPYLWAAGMEGDVGVRQLTAQGAAMSFPDIMKSLRAGFMGSLEGRNGAFGFYADAIYMQLHQKHPATHGFLGDVDAKPTQQAYALAGTWRAIPGEQPVDLFLGIRSNYVKVNLDVSPGAVTPGRTLDASRTWADGYIGARITIPVGPRWSFTGYADVGAGGSDSTWQAMAGLEYAISPASNAKFGYRYFKVDYHKDDFLWNMATGGPYLGVSFGF